jgi:hypothetical protein
MIGFQGRALTFVLPIAMRLCPPARGVRAVAEQPPRATDACAGARSTRGRSALSWRNAKASMPK